MRFFFCFVIAFTMLCACAAPAEDAFIEHGPDAGVHGYCETTVFCAGPDGSLSEIKKQLPWQTGMEDYALSFVLSDPDTQFITKRIDERVTVNITNFPLYSAPTMEAAAIAGIVNTMLSFPNTEAVTLIFQGNTVETLPQGTQVNTVFTSCIHQTD